MDGKKKKTCGREREKSKNNFFEFYPQNFFFDFKKKNLWVNLETGVFLSATN